LKKIYFSVLLFAIQWLHAQEPNHQLSSIPDALRTNANAIIVLDDNQIILENPYKMTVTKHKIITVLNKNGNNYAHINVGYDNHSSVKSIKATIYNAFGFEIKKIKSSEINDYSATTGNSLYTDDRIKNYEYLPLNYPYTIDYTSVEESENTAFYPRWYPIQGYYVSTIDSHFTVKYPADQFKINVSEKYFSGYSFSNTSAKGYIEYRANKLNAIVREPYSPDFTNFAPQVLLAPSKFNLSGVHGEANNWQEFGTWMYNNLLLGRDQLSIQTKAEIKKLVSGIDDPIERARKVYAYMQNKTHYISVQIGVGGWKPIAADEVDRMKYGDCKALVNYTQALLKEADVNTYYTVVHADDKKDIDKDFIAMQGNHAILFLPTKKDTVWLECTTQAKPFGYMGTFTNDRDVLVVKPEGGEIVHTKVYAFLENYQNSVGNYRIDENGNLKGVLNMESSGIQFENHFQISNEPHDEIVKFYKSYFEKINNLTIVNFDNQTNTLNNKFNESVTIEASNYAQKSGDRMLLTLNAFSQNTSVPKRIINRQLPVEIQNGYIDRDSITINLPKNYKIESLTNSEKISSEFGTYSIEVIKLNDNTLIYKRNLRVYQGNYPKEAYEAFRKFKKDILSKDQTKTILIKL